MRLIPFKAITSRKGAQVSCSRHRTGPAACSPLSLSDCAHLNLTRCSGGTGSSCKNLIRVCAPGLPTATRLVHPLQCCLSIAKSVPEIGALHFTYMGPEGRARSPKGKESNLSWHGTQRFSREDSGTRGEGTLSQTFHVAIKSFLPHSKAKIRAVALKGSPRTVEP